VTSGKFLPLLNLVGCIAITTVIALQWTREHRLQGELNQSRDKVDEIQVRYEAEKSRATALENDVRQLKESVEAAAAARKETEEAMAKLIDERDAQLATTTDAAAAREEQVKAWEKGIAERDAKIRELDAALVSARARLDEAIAKLKQAAR